MSPATKQVIRGMLREVVWHSDDTLALLGALCPACGFEHKFCVDPDGTGRHGTRDVWTFDGNYDRPTFSPSMLANKNRQEDHHPLCHSFVQNGQWKFLGDCTHDMAGQTVDMIPPDPEMGFERRHGWHLFPWCDPKTGKPASVGGDPLHL